MTGSITKTTKIRDEDAKKILFVLYRGRNAMIRIDLSDPTREQRLSEFHEAIDLLERAMGIK